MISRYYLEPQFDHRKSFYNRAVVTIDDDGNKKLFSYETLIAELDSQKNLKLHDGCYYDNRDDEHETYFDSDTTRRHLNEFLLQNGLNSMNKSEMIKFYKNQEKTEC